MAIKTLKEDLTLKRKKTRLIKHKTLQTAQTTDTNNDDNNQEIFCSLLENTRHDLYFSIRIIVFNIPSRITS